MSKQTPVRKPTYSLLPTDVEGFDSLAELALDMRWSWNHATLAVLERSRSFMEEAGQPLEVQLTGTRSENLSNLCFGEMKVATDGGNHIFEVQVYLSGLDPKTMRVELYADGVNSGEPVRLEMKRLRPLTGAAGGYVYNASVPATRPATDYTARLIPHYPGVAVPLEAPYILWQR